MSPLSENQRRHVLSTFAHVDGLLREIERLTQLEASPLATERPDIPADEARVLLAMVADLRRHMLVALDRLGVPRETSPLSARWRIRTNLTFAQIALAELSPEALRGFGPVSPELAGNLPIVTAALSAIIDRARAAIQQPH